MVYRAFYYPGTVIAHNICVTNVKSDGLVIQMTGIKVKRQQAAYS
jgi:hypothetical protein